MIKRIAVLADFLEEGWPSMDRTASEFARAVNQHSTKYQAELLRPAYQTALASLSGRAGKNFDRFFNRFVVYRSFLKANVDEFDLFYVADHSYAHLVNYLPADRTAVYCHDTNMFLPLYEPGPGKKEVVLKWMRQSVLKGLRKAQWVFYSTESVKESLLTHKMVDASKLTKSLYGVSATFNGKQSSEKVQSALQGKKYILHVGNPVPRKRVDLILQALAKIENKDIHFVQVGPRFPNKLLDLVRKLNLETRVMQLSGLSEPELAVLYQQAVVFVFPSDTEGFGFPIIESLASGCPVIATNIPASREVGASLIYYVERGNSDQLASRLNEFFSGKLESRPTSDIQSHLSQFSWEAHANRILSQFD